MMGLEPTTFYMARVCRPFWGCVTEREGASLDPLPDCGVLSLLCLAMFLLLWGVVERGRTLAQTGLLSPPRLHEHGSHGQSLRDLQLGLRSCGPALRFDGRQRCGLPPSSLDSLGHGAIADRGRDWGRGLTAAHRAGQPSRREGGRTVRATRTTLVPPDGDAKEPHAMTTWN
jgi:hypothetical protein